MKWGLPTGLIVLTPQPILIFTPKSNRLEYGFQIDDMGHYGINCTVPIHR